PVCRAESRGAGGARPLFRSSPPLYCSPPGGTPRALEPASPAIHSRRRARPVRSTSGLSLFAALPLCHRPLSRQGSATARRSGRRAVPLSPAPWHTGRPSRPGGGMTGETVVRASELTRYYEVSRGVFRERGLLKAVDGASFTVDRGKT